MAEIKKDDNGFVYAMTGIALFIAALAIYQVLKPVDKSKGLDDMDSRSEDQS